MSAIRGGKPEGMNAVPGAGARGEASAATAPAAGIAEHGTQFEPSRAY
jgi:hypothetical protein